MSEPHIEEQTAPNPATTSWVPVGPGLPGVGVPTPVVNGQWIKGVGGAAVWSGIADADVPSVAQGGRLGQQGVTVTDCNMANQNGWYWMNPGAANQPANDWFSILAVVLNTTTNVRQIAYAYQSDQVFMRRSKDGVWGPWQSQMTQITGASGVVVGQITVSCPLGYGVDMNVPLAKPWSLSHNAFVCGLWPLADWNFHILGMSANALSTGAVHLDNPGTAQQFNVSYVSYGT